MENQTHGEDIRLGGHFGCPESAAFLLLVDGVHSQLRGEVVRCAGDGVQRNIVLEERTVKVNDFGNVVTVSVSDQHNIGQLQVAVNDVLRVDGLQRTNGDFQHQKPLLRAKAADNLSILLFGNGIFNKFGKLHPVVVVYRFVNRKYNIATQTGNLTELIIQT